MTRYPQNPYATPAATVSDAATPEVADAEEVRRAHLSTEANIRAIGALFFLGGVVVLAMAVVMGFAGFAGGETDAEVGIIVGALFLALGLAQAWTGSAMRRFQPGARIPAIIFGILSLFNIPIGTLMGIFVLFLMLGAKGQRVMSEDYARIVELTPHIHYKTSILVWIILAIFVIGIAAAVILPMVA